MDNKWVKAAQTLEGFLAYQANKTMDERWGVEFHIPIVEELSQVVIDALQEVRNGVRHGVKMG